jgi:hypothetical protein
MISAIYNPCRVRCPQRINPAASKRSPLRTADATQPVMLSGAKHLWPLHLVCCAKITDSSLPYD